MKFHEKIFLTFWFHEFFAWTFLIFWPAVMRAVEKFQLWTTWIGCQKKFSFFYWCSSCSYIFQLTWLVRFGWQLADFHCCYSELVILISWMNIVGGCTTLCEHYFCCSTALYTRYIIWHSSVTQCWLCQNLLLLCSRLLYISICT